MKGNSAIAVITTLLVLSGCHRVFSNLVIKNESSGMVSDIVVSYRGGSFKLGDLEAGTDTRFTGYLAGEGVAAIVYTAKGRRLSYDTCYFTGGMPPRGEVVIRDDGASRRCD